MSCDALKKVCKIYNGNSINADFKKKNFAGLKEGYPYIATKDVSFSGEINYDNGVRIPFDTRFKVAPAGSVLICAEGGSAGRKIARVNQPVCFGNKLFCLAPEDKIDTDYLYHYLKSDQFQSQFKFMMSGLIGGVSAKKFGAIEIRYPSIKEQRIIIERINNVALSINILKGNIVRGLSDATTYFKSIAVDLLSDYGEASHAMLGDIVTLQRGIDLTHSEMTGGDIPVAGSSGIIGYHNEAKGPSPCITVGRSGNVGKVFMYEKCWPHNTTLFVKDYKSNWPRYIYHLLYNLNAADYSGGAAVPTLNRNNLHPVLVPFCNDIDKQKSIAKQLDAISDRYYQITENYNTILKECDAFIASLLKDTFE